MAMMYGMCFFFRRYALICTSSAAILSYIKWCYIEGRMQWCQNGANHAHIGCARAIWKSERVVYILKKHFDCLGDDQRPVELVWSLRETLSGFDSRCFFFYCEFTLFTWSPPCLGNHSLHFSMSWLALQSKSRVSSCWDSLFTAELADSSAHCVSPLFLRFLLLQSDSWFWGRESALKETVKKKHFFFLSNEQPMVDVR